MKCTSSGDYVHRQRKGLTLILNMTLEEVVIILGGRDNDTKPRKALGRREHGKRCRCGGFGRILKAGDAAYHGLERKHQGGPRRISQEIIEKYPSIKIEYTQLSPQGRGVCVIRRDDG